VSFLTVHCIHLECAHVLLFAQDDMARGGYRTLLISDRDLRREEYDKWQEAYSAASVSSLDHTAHNITPKSYCAAVVSSCAVRSHLFAILGCTESC